MRPFFDFHLRVVILNALLSSDSNNVSRSGATAELIEKGLTTSKKSKSLTDDIVTLMQTLGSSNNPQHIRLLYCPENQDELADVTFKLSSDLIGLTTHCYEGSESELIPVLSPSPNDIPVSLFTFCSPRKVLDIFRKINNQSLDSHKVRWLIVIDGSEDITQFLYQLETLVYEGMQVTILAKQSNHAFDVLWESVDPDGNINFLYEGRWNLRDNILMDQMLNHLEYDNSRSLHYDLSGRRMTLAAKQLPASFIFGEVYSDGSVEPKSGVEVKILKRLGSTYNFTYRVVPSEDNLYGNPQPDGSVNGMVGMLARREISMVISALSVSESRETVIDFTAGYHGGAVTLISRSPRQRSGSMAILYPFNFKVWVAIALSVMFMGCCIFILSNLLTLSGLKNMKKSGLGSHLFNVYRSIVVQGYHLNDQYWATRFLLFSWFTFCLIILALYSGMLTAVLALPSYETPINSLNDLPKAIEDGFTLGVLKESYHEQLFKSATEGIYKKTWELFNHEDPLESFVDSNHIGMKRVLDRKFVFVVTDIVAELSSMRFGRRKFYFGREKFSWTDAAIGCQRGSPFVERLSIAMLRLAEGGITRKWVNQELKKLEQLATNSNSEEVSSNPMAFSLTHLQAAFIVLILGFLVAALIFLSENMFDIELRHHESSSGVKEKSIFGDF